MVFPCHGNKKETTWLGKRKISILSSILFSYHDRQIGGGRLQSPVYQNIRGSFTQFIQAVERRKKH